MPIASELRGSEAAVRKPLDSEIMRRRQLADPGKGASRRRDIGEAQIAVDRRQVGLAHDTRPGEQRLDLGSKEKRSIGGGGIAERLFADPVARKDQALRPPVPDGQREHAAQPAENACFPGVPAIDDDFGVAAAAEPVAQRFELLPNLEEIVDLAIVADPHRAVGARHRLMAGGRGIDDRQAGMGETRPAIGPDALVIRPAMPQRRDHGAQPRLQLAGRQCRTGQEETADAAHWPLLSNRARRRSRPSGHARETGNLDRPEGR